MGYLPLQFVIQIASHLEIRSLDHQQLETHSPHLAYVMARNRFYADEAGLHSGVSAPAILARESDAVADVDQARPMYSVHRFECSWCKGSYGHT